MATFNCDMSQVEGLFARLSTQLDSAADEVLIAGAEVVKQCMIDAATAAGYAPPGTSGRGTGRMIGSISYGAPKGGGGSKHIDIYPKGSHGKKTSNAKVAFVLNFGRSNYKGTHWVEAANAAASGPAQAAMEAKFHELFHD